MKYFWYYTRASYRTAQYNAGFYAASVGLNKACNNSDYVLGYIRARDNLQAQAEEAGMLTQQLRRSTARIEAMFERTENVKRAVAENL